MGPGPKIEEADWYASPEGAPADAARIRTALKNGTLVRSSGSHIPRTSRDVLKTLMEQAKANAARPVSIRLSIADIEIAKRIASKRGIGYQTVLRQAIRYGLKRAGQLPADFETVSVERANSRCQPGGAGVS